jgi:cysteine synthase
MTPVLDAAADAHVDTTGTDRLWVIERIARLREEAAAAVDTPLMPLAVPARSGLTLYLKDETRHPSGSLKHRLARSLFLYALCNQWLRPGRPAVDASSGSTAISEAWFARLLGVPYIAVLPASTAPAKIAELRALGARCELLDDPSGIYARAAAIAEDSGGCYLDQFTFAERATDWRGNNNIAESILDQLETLGAETPTWFVAGAGTGGTLATVGRYLRYRGLTTRLCLADPEGSVLAQAWRSGDAHAHGPCLSVVEGIGRPRVEPSFMPALIDQALSVPDAASIGAMQFLAQLSGRRLGGSSGTHLYACLSLAAQGATGAVVSLLGDAGERYAETLYDEAWLAAHQIDPAPWRRHIERFWTQGVWQPPR